MNFMAFDLNLLRVLDALLTTGSTVRAGERIGLSQPAVSSALSRLRGQLGDPLFVRQGQRLEPTDYARTLAAPLRESLERLQTMLSGPEAFDPGAARLDFRISASDFFTEVLMPPLATRISALAPGIRLQLIDLAPADYLDTLENRLADVALIPQGDFPDWVETRALFHSSFGMIARKDHPRLARAGVAPGGTVPVDLFCDLGHVLMSPEGKFRSFADAALERTGRQRRVVMTLPTFSGVCRAVAANDLVAVVPRQFALHMAGRGIVEAYVPPVSIAPATIVMAWHRRATGTPSHRWMRGQIAAELEPLNAGEAAL